ncbi:MAG: hypothetical protein WCF04_03905 [Candidatus Nanopelagicales bacterium]
MFSPDQSPDRVRATAGAAAHLGALATEAGDMFVTLTEDGSALPSLLPPPTQDTVFLGEVAGIRCLADAAAPIPWWRCRVTLAFGDDGVTYELSELDEAEVFAALASGPLPRYWARR